MIQQLILQTWMNSPRFWGLRLWCKAFGRLNPSTAREVTKSRSTLAKNRVWALPGWSKTCSFGYICHPSTLYWSDPSYEHHSVMCHRSAPWYCEYCDMFRFRFLKHHKRSISTPVAPLNTWVGGANDQRVGPTTAREGTRRPATWVGGPIHQFAWVGRLVFNICCSNFHSGTQLFKKKSEVRCFPNILSNTSDQVAELRRLAG